MIGRRFAIILFACIGLTVVTGASAVPTRAQKGMVASQNEIASKIGADAIAVGVPGRAAPRPASSSAPRP